MQLADLIPTSGRTISGTDEIQISGLTADSRAVKPGYLFAALPGTRDDGAKFIHDALNRGAVAVLTHAGWQGEAGNDALVDHQDTPVLDCRNPRRDLAIAAARYYERQPKPSAPSPGQTAKLQ